MSKKPDLTWGDVMIAATSASMAVGWRQTVDRKRLISDIEEILGVTGTAQEVRMKGLDRTLEVLERKK